MWAAALPLSPFSGLEIDRFRLRKLSTTCVLLGAIIWTTATVHLCIYTLFRIAKVLVVEIESPFGFVLCAV
jgi:hypothetical protein